MTKSLVALAKKKPLTEREAISRLMTAAIIGAELFGSGKRNASGCTTKSKFIANRGNVMVNYEESSGEMYCSGHLEVIENNRSVLHAVRSLEGDYFLAGIPPQLGYKIITLNLAGFEQAMHNFYEGLKPIGYPGLTLPIRL